MIIKHKPVIGITMGDPAGIGPEVIAKALARAEIHALADLIVIGDAKVMAEAIDIVEADLGVRSIDRIGGAEFSLGTMNVLDLKNVDMSRLKRGEVSAMGGKAAFEAVTKSIELAMEGTIAATVTGPINKESLNLGGFSYSGHTEIFADYTKTKDYAMLLVDGNLRVIHVSTHVSLRRACDLVTKERVLSVIRLAHDACRSFGIESPDIGVAGLNPHASEGGLFGWEEEREIIPAIEAARAMGIRANGPVPADTLFSKVKGGLHDIAVAMYHDQGHIPVKVGGFIWDGARQRWQSVTGINITVGLPIIRVSVDHGTAFDQAGKGTANEESLVNAIEYALKMAAFSDK